MRIRQEVLRGSRATYGEQIVSALSGQLTVDYGPGFARSNLFNMLRFAEVYPDERIVHALRGQLSWSHLRQIIYLEDRVQRERRLPVSDEEDNREIKKLPSLRPAKKPLHQKRRK